MSLTITSLAFSAGAVSFLNPCGFALLPVYLAYYFKNESLEEKGILKKIFYGALYGIFVSIGIAVVFSLIGLIVSFAGSGLLRYAGHLDFVIGIILVIIGFSYLFNLKIRLDFITNAGERIKSKKIQNKYLSFFLYGVGFAIASLGCTLPIFLAIVAASIKASSIFSGLLVFLSYAAGMSVFMVVFSIAVALSKKIIEATLRKWLPYIYRLGSVIVIIAGAYLIYNQIVLGRLFG